MDEREGREGEYVLHQRIGLFASVKTRCNKVNIIEYH